MNSDSKNYGSGDLFSNINQIRLSEISVFNWGSFNGLHNAKIDIEGTLITGDNGSGKSTFIDGLMGLLLPAGRATFNVAAAQGDRSDRTLLSYMRGSFGSAHDGGSTRVKSKREGAVVTGLRALYRSDYNQLITLAAIFWTTQASNSLADVKRIYIVAKRNLELKELLEAFGNGNSRTLKQWLKKDSTITCCDDSFSNYQELYRKLLYMENKNAPALLSRALGLKKIDDLTGLIRDLVLEPSTIKEDARKVVDEFTDLVAIHTKLIDARAQKDHLLKLPELNKNIETAEKKLEILLSERDGLAIYFGEICCRLWDKKIAEYKLALADLSLLIKQTSEEENDKQLLVEGRHEDYIKAGGGRIESLKKELKSSQEELARVVNRSSRYQTDVRELDLNDQLQENIFLENQSLIKGKLSNINDDNRKLQNSFGEVAGKLSEFQKNESDIGNEILAIEARPDSNIDIKFQQLRDELVKSLDIDREQCCFIGELIDVREQHQLWQGAIERALGGLRTTLLVPDNCFSMVTRWLNTRHTGLHVRVQVVKDKINTERNSSKRGEASRFVEFKSNGFLSKLTWRNHPYRDWLKSHLVRFDLQCVLSTEELDSTPFSMSQQGLMHMDKGRFEKKDQNKVNDRRRWCLGFSNKSRLAILRNDKNDLAKKIAETLKLVDKARESLDEIGKRKSLWQRLREYRWSEINAPYWQSKTTQLQDDIQVLELSGSDLDNARRRWELAKQELAIIRSAKDEYLKKEGELSKTLTDAKAKQNESASMASSGLLDSVRNLLEQRVGILTYKALDQAAMLLNQHSKDIEQALESWRGKKSSAEKSAIGTMSSFRSHEKWRVIASDWGCDVASLEEYLVHLNQLEVEGLPNLVDQFVERLNKHATQSLAQIRQNLDSKKDEIIDRIDKINSVLMSTEFRVGSRLKLGAKIEKYPHVMDFNRHVSKVLSQATSDDHEARFSQLSLVVDILAKASNPTTSGTLESLRLLDPRYQMSFYAEELDAVTKEVRDVLESSSGKSGGEKESFAGTIVAASLAYVLTPTDYDCPVYSTVFLDEAFSNTAEAVSRRVLRVFKELNIHVNLITPYKNLNLAREFAGSLLIAERDQENHDSHLCEVTWEEIDRRLKSHHAHKVSDSIVTLDTEVEYV